MEKNTINERIPPVDELEEKISLLEVMRPWTFDDL